MVFSGLFDRHPNLKVVTHHMGGMVPYFEGRVGPGWEAQFATNHLGHYALVNRLWPAISRGASIRRNTMRFSHFVPSISSRKVAA